MHGLVEAFAGFIKPMTKQRSKQKIEFGDFQTPGNLANEVCNYLRAIDVRPQSLLEPTCGEGNLLLAALDTFSETVKAVGIEINPAHIASLQHKLRTHTHYTAVEIITNDFFAVQWNQTLQELPEPILVIGNPPWVTNAELTGLNSQNLPHKVNFQNHSGLDARTGKSNFDISEWMIIHLLEQLQARQATVAMLCKTSVARKVLTYAWKNHLPITHARICRINASQHFAADVDACLFVCGTAAGSSDQRCQLYNALDPAAYASSFGYEDGRLIADLTLYTRWRHLRGSSAYRWRSGIKHDCASIMEFQRQSNHFINGFGEAWPLESAYLYPLLKSSDLMRALPSEPLRWLLVTQRRLGEETKVIQNKAPLTWAYLQAHGEYFDRRKSTIYQNHPRFSVFGVGDYTFSPWKVAISGLYKRLHFVAVGPLTEKPVVFDDTCYFLACQCQEEAELLATLLNSDVAQEFFQTLVFWDAKRPITSEILNQLNITTLADELQQSDQLLRFTAAFVTTTQSSQLILFS
jgi:hypothetical protein